jgi:N-acetylmuramic acid 6-phosphate etherase
MKPITEEVNPKTADIDLLPAREIVRLINEEDKAVAESVSRVLPSVAEAVELIVERLSRGGHLLYIGAGTSGRLGVLDASECPPTFGVPPDMVRGVIAGGPEALSRAIEAAEDDPKQGARDLQGAGLSAKDVVVGISASGTTPYTLGAIEHAKSVGAATIALTCNPDSPLAATAQISIVPAVGPEVIAGSSRMKAGTAQKMILNMLSTAAMIRLGFVYKNLMSNLQPNNAKLIGRAIAILSQETGLSAEEARSAFESAGRDLRVALLMVHSGLSRDQAEQLLRSHGGSVRRALASIRNAQDRAQ